MQEIKTCVDKTLPLRSMPQAAMAALRENAGNSPDSSLLADLVEVLARTEDRPEIASALLLTNKRWQPGREIKVGWFRDEFTEDDQLRDRIRYHVNFLETYMNLNFRFIGFNTEDADIRITMERGGSWSYVGVDNLLIPRDEPTMQFGWLDHDIDDPDVKRVSKHEFLHAAGLGHEHQSPKDGLPWNLEAVYAHYGSTQGWSREETYRQVIRRYSTSMVVATQRDPESIMHYAVPAALLLEPSKAVGWNDDLSEGDKVFLRSIYPYSRYEAA